jgi:hypothetical protein
MIWHEASAYFNAIFVPLLTVAGAVAAVLATIAKYRDRRESDMRDAITIWQSLAEAAKAENVAIQAKLVLSETKLEAHKDRCDYLWTEVLRRTDVGTLTRDPERYRKPGIGEP